MLIIVNLLSMLVNNVLDSRVVLKHIKARTGMNAKNERGEFSNIYRQYFRVTRHSSAVYLSVVDYNRY